MPAIDPADAPWPDRENLPAKPAAGTAKSADVSDLLPATNATDATGRADDEPAEAAELAEPGTDASAPTATVEQGEPPVKQAEPEDAPPGKADEATGKPESQSGSDSGSGTKRESRPGRRPPANRSRIIRPAGYARFSRAIPRQPGPSSHPQDQDAGAASPRSSSGGPRDFELADDTVFDFGDGDRYIPPPLPPMGRLDPVAAGAWIALFGGPAFLLVSMLAGWQTPRWMALVAVIAFVAGFIVLVFRLGDGPSKRDGPDQGAVV
jgi:hypothetical protein